MNKAQVSPYYRTVAKHLGAEFGSPGDSTGPIKSELKTYNPGKAPGLVAGAHD